MTANNQTCGSALRKLLRSTAIAGCAVVVLAAVGDVTAAASSTPAEISASGYPISATFVPVSKASSLQTLLDQNHVVRLENGDYSKALSKLTIQSGYKVYGLPKTILPPVTVTPGTTGAVLSTLILYSLTFPASTVSTNNNLFLSLTVMASPGLNAKNAVLENNLFLNTYGMITLDDSASGYIRNNRFIKTWLRGSGSAPMMTLAGNTTTTSYNNTLLMSVLTTPAGDGFYFHGLTDLSVIGVDAESWNQSNLTTTHAPHHVDNSVGTLRMVGVGGGSGNTGANLVPFEDISANKFLVLDDSVNSSHAPKINLGSTVGEALYLNDVSAKITTSNALKANWTGSLYFRDTGSATSLLGQANTALKNAMVDVLKANMNTSAANIWEAPVYDAVPDPAGSTWNKNLASQPDSTTYIQGLINSATTVPAILPAGTYYISQPLTIKSGQGLIGAGMGNTVIIAKSSSVDMIVGGDKLNACYSPIINITLTDFTLEGGANGIHHGPGGSGACAQHSQLYISHVTFRNMANAGIFEDKTYGYDNILLDHLNFVNNQYGVLQTPDPGWNGTDPSPGMGYMDKTVFYANQFISNGIGVQLLAGRADNLNVWVNSLFQGNTGGAVVLKNNNYAIFANSDFINNGGASALAVNGSAFPTCVSCRFQAGANGKSMLGSGFATALDSTFSQSGGNATILATSGASPSAQNDFFNSYTADMPLGTVNNGYFFNNDFAKNTAYNDQALVVTKGVSTILSSTKVTSPPVAQFLRGTALQFRY